MSYEYITQYDSPNYTQGRQGLGIKEIVIHHWGNDGQSFNGVVNWLCRSNGTSSAHYVVEAGRVACLVDCANTAWHAGNWNHNLISIGIECRPEMSASDLETVCELVADIYKVYGVLPIIGHKDVSATACPGRYYAKLAYIKQRAIEIMGGSPSAPSEPVMPDQVCSPGSVVVSSRKHSILPGIKTIGSDECVQVPDLGGWFPTRLLNEADASDGALDQYLANSNAKVTIVESTVKAIDAVKNLIKIHDIWVDPTYLTEIKDGQ